MFLVILGRKGDWIGFQRRKIVFRERRIAFPDSQIVSRDTWIRFLDSWIAFPGREIRLRDSRISRLERAIAFPRRWIGLPDCWTRFRQDGIACRKRRLACWERRRMELEERTHGSASLPGRSLLRAKDEGRSPCDVPKSIPLARSQSDLRGQVVTRQALPLSGETAARRASLI